MPVVMKGGTSGCEHDYLPTLPTNWFTPPADGGSSTYKNPNLQWPTPSGNRQDASPDVPTSAPLEPRDRNATTEDICQQDVAGFGPNSGDETVFRGAPNTGTKGGPA